MTKPRHGTFEASFAAQRATVEFDELGTAHWKGTIVSNIAPVADASGRVGVRIGSGPWEGYEAEAEVSSQGPHLHGATAFVAPDGDFG